MIHWFQGMHPVMQAFVATTFTWLVTAAGAVPVFFVVRLNQKFFDGILGMAAGVMIAASFWSLLAPAIEMAGGAWHPALIGFLAGGLFLAGIDKILPHLHPDLDQNQAEGPHTNWRRSVLLLLAMTIHNLPEGMAVGVAFGAAGLGHGAYSMGAAIALTIGIGLQNLPEGLAVALPLRREGMGRFRCFMFGQASALVEPIGGILGAALVLTMTAILPYALAFAAGAMIFVVVEELVPESQRHGNTDFATLGCLFGFALMMLLDVALG